VQQLMQAISGLKKLETLDISCCKSITAKFFDMLSAAAPPRLAALAVSKIVPGRPNRLTSPALAINDPLVAIPTLTRLDLTGIHTVSKASLQKIADNGAHLECTQTGHKHIFLFPY
jgi:hypothetical protein